MQKALDNLANWESDNKATVSIEKTETCVFGHVALAEAKRPALTFRGAPLKYNPTPKFLGLTIDESVTFAPHVERIRAKMISRGSILKALGGTRWGCGHKTLRMLHLAFNESCMLYGLAAYGPSTAASTLDKLQAQQYSAAC
eukprot:gene11055-20041_t